MFGRRMTLRRPRRRGRRAVPFIPAATGVEGLYEDEPYRGFGPTREGEQTEMFAAEDIERGGRLYPYDRILTVVDRPVLNRRQFIRRYKSELKQAYDAACGRLRAMGRDCPNYAQLARLTHEMYREHRRAGSNKPVLHIIYEASVAAWDPSQPQEIMLRRMEKSWGEFRDEYKDLINLARADGNNPAFGKAASVAFKAYKAEPDRTKALEAARIAILEIPPKRRKTVSKKPSTRKPKGRKPVAKPKMSKARRAAMRKPPGAKCTSVTGRKAAEQQLEGISPTKLKDIVPDESKDVLLYRLQAEMSTAGKRRPRVVSMLKRALKSKGLEKLPSKFDKTVAKKTKPKTKPRTKAKGKTKPKSKPKTAAGKPRYPVTGKASVQARATFVKKNKATISAAVKKASKEAGKTVNWISAANVAFKKCATMTPAKCKTEIPKVILAGTKAGKIALAGASKRKTSKPKSKPKAAAKRTAAKKTKPTTKPKPKGKAKSKPQKDAEAKAKRAKGKIKTDKKNLTKARQARDKAPAAKKPAKRKVVAKVEAKLKKDKKELATAEKSITKHKAKAAKTTPKKAPPTRTRRTTPARAGKSVFRVKGNITGFGLNSLWAARCACGSARARLT